MPVYQFSTFEPSDRIFHETSYFIMLQLLVTIISIIITALNNTR